MMNSTDPLDEPLDLPSGPLTLAAVIEARDTLWLLGAVGAIDETPYLSDLLFSLQQIINVEAKKEAMAAK